MAQMRKARSKHEVLMLQRVIDEAHAERGKELRAVGRVKWSGTVVWGPPGAEGESRQECEFDSEY